MLFTCKVRVAKGTIVELEPTEEKSLEDAKYYYENYVAYWSKVWFGWKNAEIVSIEEVKTDPQLTADLTRK